MKRKRGNLGNPNSWKFNSISLSVDLFFSCSTKRILFFSSLSQKERQSSQNEHDLHLLFQVELSSLSLSLFSLTHRLNSLCLHRFIFNCISSVQLETSQAFGYICFFFFPNNWSSFGHHILIRSSQYFIISLTFFFSIFPPTLFIL